MKKFSDLISTIAAWLIVVIIYGSLGMAMSLTILSIYWMFFQELQFPSLVFTGSFFAGLLISSIIMTWAQYKLRII